MEVIAVATPGPPDWRWRIVNRAGEIIAESRQVYPSIAAAIAKGAKRFKAMNAVDRSDALSGRGGGPRCGGLRDRREMRQGGRRGVTNPGGSDAAAH